MMLISPLASDDRLAQHSNAPYTRDCPPSARSRVLDVPLCTQVEALREVAPKEWSSVGGHEDFKDCTIVQMDIAGFTKMASELDAVELIDLLNVFFMHIDEAAEYIGNIWKVRQAPNLSLPPIMAIY